ncbi:MAG: type III secretion system export apparatus subunit SctV [Blastocatellia bacterium]
MSQTTSTLTPPSLRGWQKLLKNKSAWLALLTEYRSLVFPVLAILCMLTLFVPLTPFLIDVLVCLNIALTFAVVTRSLSISTPLQLTSYPTILLITPVFRLCLSLAVTRSILETGHAGDIITMIGHFTSRGNLVVAFVTFIMILFVQFIVVTKGAERVAEVAARFTLDALPGKQMAIDADLRSGLITQEQARRLRQNLGRESQLYGAMDGAMKFVKGDSIATIVLALVNIVGGLIVGTLYKGLSIAQASQKYTILTMGDGLAAIITSMMVATAAGFVITRVASEDETGNVSTDLMQQFMNDPKPLWLTSIAIAMMALLPGAPIVLLLVVALVIAGVGYWLFQKQKREAEQALAAAGDAPLVATAFDDVRPSYTVPIAAAVSLPLASLIDPETAAGQRLRQSLVRLRTSLYYDLGVLLPQVFVSASPPVAPYEYFIAVKEIPVGKGRIRPDHLFINDAAENIRVFGIEGEEVVNPADLRPGAWIPVDQREIAEVAGLKIWEPDEILTLHLSRLLKRHAHEFIGIQEAQSYLDFAAQGLPKLVEEVVPKTITIHQFTEVLQRLVQEEISIRDIKTILEALSEWGRIEKDPVMLTEYVRSSLKRYVTFRFTGGRDTLYVYLLDPEIEDVIRGAIRRTSTGSFLSLDPALSQEILQALRREIGNPYNSGQKPVVITDMELRRFVHKMVEIEFPTLAVLSYQELTPDLNVQPLARVSMRPSNPQYVTDTAALS